jgi:transposase
MGVPQKVPLRILTEYERKALSQLSRATSERVDVVRKATALWAVAEGKNFTEAGRSSGLSREGVSQLVERFNQRSLAVLLIAPGRGRKATYTVADRQRIIQEVQRVPDRQTDQTATWSLSLLQKAFRKTIWPKISRESIRQILHENGYSYQRTRTWCHTGYALRKRKSGTVTVYDPDTAGKKG